MIVRDWKSHCESQVSASEEKARERQENLGREPLSNCCGADMQMGEWLDIMVCPDCREHCGVDYN